MALAQSPGTFTATGTMSTARIGHTATLLPNGKVLIAGGNSGAGILASAELYDPGTGRFAANDSMTTARYRHTAILLANGAVLLAGGYGLADTSTRTLASAELYDSSTGRFTATGDMLTAQFGYAAVLLGNGKVLIVGGAQRSSPLEAAGAELYDPAIGTFTSAGTDAGDNGLYWVTATPLPDGRILLAGGYTLAQNNNLAQIYDPDAGAFLLTGAMKIPAYKYGMTLHTAVLLANGKVLIGGGESDEDSFDVYNGTQLYDPDTGTFAASAVMSDRRSSHTATLLPDGTVLIAGGDTWIVEAIPGTSGVISSYGGTLDRAELYDAGSGTFSAVGPMSVSRAGHSATLLNSGSVLITGGVADVPFHLGVMQPRPVLLATAELYNPPTFVPAPVLLSISRDGQGQGAILHADTHETASATNPANPAEALEIYCTGLIDGSVIPPQVAIGGRLAKVLFFGKAPGFASLNQLNVLVPTGITPGSAVQVRLNYLGRTSNEVTIGVR